MVKSGRKVFAVFGASGQQGGGVISFFLRYPGLTNKFHIRAISRNVADAKAKCIFSADQVTWAQADLSQPQTVLDALEGVDIVFGLNNFWEHCDYDLDIAQGKAIVDACIAKRVEWLIWSSQYFAKDTTQGENSFAPYTDGKAAISQYAEKWKHTGGRHGRGMIVTHVIPPFYWQNLSNFLVWPNEAGDLLWKMPWNKDAVLPFIDSEIDVGAYTAAIMLSNPTDMNGKSFHVCSQWMSTAEMLDQFQKITRKKMLFQQVSPSEFSEILPPSPGWRKWLPQLFEMVGLYTEWGVGSQDIQHEHDRVLARLGTGFQKSSWTNYVRRGAFMREYKARMEAMAPLRAKL